MIKIELKKAHIEAALLFVNKKSGKMPVISGVHVNVTSGIVAVQTTDNAAFCHIAYSYDVESDMSIVLNAKDLTSALAAFKGDTYLTLTFDDNNVTMRGGKGEMGIGTIEGQYPLYTRINLGEDTTDHNLLHFDLARVIKAAKIIDDSTKNPIIQIRLKTLGALVTVREAEFMLCGIEQK